MLPIISLLVLLSYSGLSQDITSNDSIPKEDFLVGIFDRQQLQKGDFGKYFLEEYADYEPNNEVLLELKKSIYNKSIIIFLATWCHDSQIQLGRFYKILDLLDYNTRNLPNYCLDKEKKAGDLDLSTFDMEWVPTFIFYDGKKEIGRIVESPEISLEKDMLNILSQ
jgi:hypothetical protein